MCRTHRTLRAAVSLAALVLALLAVESCYVSLFVTTGPSPVGSIVVTSDPAAVSAQTIVGAACPGSPPFFVQFRLVIREDRGVDAQLREVRLRFVDRSGVTSLDVLLTATDLGRQFDSTLVAAHTSRDFPFSPRFGCAGDRVGALYIHVVLVDANGTNETSDLQVAVS